MKIKYRLNRWMRENIPGMASVAALMGKAGILSKYQGREKMIEENLLKAAKTGNIGAQLQLAEHYLKQLPVDEVSEPDLNKKQRAALAKHHLNGAAKWLRESRAVAGSSWTHMQLRELLIFNYAMLTRDETKSYSLIKRTDNIRNQWINDAKPADVVRYANQIMDLPHKLVSRKGFEMLIDYTRETSSYFSAVRVLQLMDLRQDQQHLDLAIRVAEHELNTGKERHGVDFLASAFRQGVLVGGFFDTPTGKLFMDRVLSSATQVVHALPSIKMVKPEPKPEPEPEVNFTLVGDVQVTSPRRSMVG